MPLQRLFEIIEEAKILKMRNFDISGGEFFLYKDWDLLLRKMLDAGFNPKSIPTKIPLNEECIKKIRDIGYEQIQISLDSMQSNILKTTLKVQDGYFKKIESMISLLKKYDVKFRVNSLITSYNCDISNFCDLIDFLKQWPNFVEISIGVVGYTLYKKNEINYLNYPKLDEAENVISYLQDKYYGDPSIVISPIAKLEDMYHYDDNQFFSKARCSGNMYGFVILPDGNITICEELYWHPEFIIGNINKQSIMEVWSSQKANDLFYLKQSLFKKKNACISCKSFTMCRYRGGVCWREVIKTYGVENWDFPDPRCKFAPEKINNLYIG